MSVCLIEASLKSLVSRLSVPLVLTIFLIAILSPLAPSGYSSSATTTPIITSVGYGQDPVSLVTSLDLALNSHDVNTALRFFSDDARVIDLAGVACPVNLDKSNSVTEFCKTSNILYENIPQIHGWLQQLKENNIALQEVGVFEVKGSNVTWSISVAVDQYRKLNVSPLVVNAQAVVKGDKIQFLTFVLDAKSTAKLAAALVGGHPLVGRFLIIGAVALFILALVYIFRIKNAFASIPRLERPWIVLEGGVALLFLGVFLIAVKDLLGLSIAYLDELVDALIAISALFILAAMFMMKRAWTVGEGE